MATIASLIVRIGGDSSGLRREIEASQRQIRRAFGSAALGASEAAVGIIGALGADMTAAGLASIKMAADMQATKTAFAGLLGSAESAESLLKDLNALVSQSTFSLPGLAESTKLLLAFGFAAEDAVPIMKVLGDHAATFGHGEEGIKRVIIALGQIKGKGKLAAQEVNQLINANIQAWPLLADAMGVSVAEVQEMSKDGAIDATTAINAILTGLQNKFTGSMARATQEINGLWGGIESTVATISVSIGEKLIEGLNIKEHLTELSDALSKFSNEIKSLGISEALKNLIPPELGAAIFALGGALAGAAIPALITFAGAIGLAILPIANFIIIGTALGAAMYILWQNGMDLSDAFKMVAVAIGVYALPSLISLAKTFTALWASMGPIGWAILVITALGTAIYVIYKNWNPILNWMKKAWNSAVNFIADNIGILLTLFWPIILPVMGVYTAWSLAIDLIKDLWNGFISFMKGIIAPFIEIFNRIQEAFSKFVEAGKVAISNFAKAIGELPQKILPDCFNDAIKIFIEFGNTVIDIATQIGNKIRDALTIKPTSQADFKKLEDTNTEAIRKSDELKTEFTGVTTPDVIPTPITPTGGKGAAAGKSDAEKEWDKLQRKAEQVSEAINREWVQTTHSQLEQLNVWRNEQIEALDETAAANKNHAEDRSKVEAVYTQRYKKILLEQKKAFLEQEQEKKSIYDRAADMAREVQQDIASISLIGSEKEIFDIEIRAVARFDEVKKEFQDLTLEFESATPEQQETFKKAWIENKILFEETTREIIIRDEYTGEEIRRDLIKTVDFAEELAKRGLLIEAQKQKELTEYHKRGNAIRANMQAAYDNYDLNAYKKALGAKEAANLAYLEGQKELMDLYQKVMMDANMSMAQAQARVGESLYSGLQEGINGLIDGTMSWGDAFKNVTQSIISSIVQIMAQMIAANMVAGIFGGMFGGIFGGGASALKGASVFKKVSGVKLASGGAVWGAGTATSDSIPAMLSNGEYVMQASAVKKFGTGFFDTLNLGKLPAFAEGGPVAITVPALPGINFSRIADFDTISGRNLKKTRPVNNAPPQAAPIYLSVNQIDTRGFERWLENSGGRKIEKYFVKRGREFASARLLK